MKKVFPARAGVILAQNLPQLIPVGFPRTRGGDPKIVPYYLYLVPFSPHARG